MAYILAIETATTVCSVALFSDDKLVDHIESDDGYSHAENLAVFTNEILKRNHLLIKNLSAIAISEGPGSYTGLRIGVAFAKGLCYSHNIPLIAINTLESIAWGAKTLGQNKEALICPMLDARRMEVYSAVYHNNLDPIIETKAIVINEDSFSKLLQSNEILFIGNGAYKCSSILKHKNANFSLSINSSAKHLGLIANQHYQSSKFVDLAYFNPFYLKDFVAIKSKKLI